MLGRAAFLTLILAAAPGAAAAQNSNFELWTTLGAEGGLGGGTGWELELVGRFGDEQGGLYEIEAGGLLTHRLSDAVTVAAGYLYVPNYRDGALTSREHRPRQQIEARVGRLAGGTVSLRARLEERFRSGGDDVGLRLRTRAAWTRPLAGRDGPRLRLWHESFFGLNDTDWGQFSGYNRARNFAGVQFGLGAALKLEAGYVHQLTLARSGPDRTAHALSLSLGAAF